MARAATAGRPVSLSSVWKPRVIGRACAAPFPANFAGTTNSAKVTSVGLFTGQLGWAANAALFYVKGGAALTNNNFLNYNTASASACTMRASSRLGGTIGVGFEYGFTPNWSAGIEYDHLMMGNANNSFSCYAGCAAVVNTISQNIDMVTVRVNYKFGGPVVARY